MDVYAQLCSEVGLREAWRKVRLKNARGGIDKVNPEDLDGCIEKVIQDLVRRLSDQTYTPAPLDRIHVPKFNDAGEWRPLSLPVVTDKIVQQALVNILEPEFDKDFLDSSYAYRPRKGPVRAIGRVNHILSSRHAKWVLTMDIDNFFDTLNHELLLAAVHFKTRDSHLTDLIRMWLRAGYISGKGDYREPDEGIAQGAVISPLLANIYLHRLDLFASERAYDYVRYSDNIIALFREREAACAAHESLRRFLAEELHLGLNPAPNPVAHISQGFTFLGIYFKGDERSMSRQKEAKTLAKLNWLTDRSTSADPEMALKRLNETIQGKKRFYAFVNPGRQFSAFDRHLASRLPGLLAAFAASGKMSSPKDFTGFLNSVMFFVDMPRADHQALVAQIAAQAAKLLETKRESPAAEKEARPKNGAAAKRSSAQKNRYLRQRSSETEVIVATPGVFIGKTGSRLILKKDRRNIHEQPFFKIRQISITATGVSLSSDVVWACSSSRVPLAFLNRQGKTYAILQTPFHSDGDLSVFQIRMYETERAVALSRKVLMGKSRNQMNVIKYYGRHRSKTDPVFSDRISRALEQMEKDIGELRDTKMNGNYAEAQNRLFTAEARVSSQYWGIVKILLPVELGFEKRQKKGAADVVNNMLNYGYGILYQRIWNAAAMAGLNPNISFLHGLQKNKPTLIYDMIEEFRQALVDRPLFSIMTRGGRYRTFALDPATGLLDNHTKETVLETVLERLAGLVGFRGQKVRADEIIQRQTKHLAEYIQGRGGVYKPFIATY